MGRPIKKDFIGQGTGRIRVTRYRFTGGSELNNPPAWIVSQRGTTTFRVSDGTTTEQLQLVDKASGLSEGEFAVDAVLDNSTVVQVTKFKNNTISYDDTNVIGYKRTGIDGDEDHTDGFASVDVQD